MFGEQGSFFGEQGSLWSWLISLCVGQGPMDNI